MKNQLQQFVSEQFGKVRVVIIDGEPWFVAADVCRALGLTNTTKALFALDDDEKQSVVLPDEMPTNGVTNTLTNSEGINGATFGWIENRVSIINEPGLYQIIFTSRKPEAKIFRRWISHEVLPSIRKTGSYSLVAKRVPNPNRREGQLKPACVYVFALENGTVKIGQSSDINRRATEIKRETDLAVVARYRTQLLPREVARLIERALHKIFSSSKIDGEFFSAKFDAVCTAVDAFVMFAEELPAPEKNLLVARRRSILPHEID